MGKKKNRISERFRAERIKQLDLAISTYRLALIWEVLALIDFMVVGRVAPLFWIMIAMFTAMAFVIETA